MYPVLLIDDEPGALKSLKYLLDWEQYGYTIAGEASGGRQALEMVREHPYSLVITDIRMPVMDGLELITELRRFSKVPIIIMSGYAEFEYVKECLKHGVKDYLLKPVEEEDLIQVLQKVKLEMEQQARIDRQLYFGIPAVRDQLLRKWANGLVYGEEVSEHLPLLDQYAEAERCYCTLIVEMDFMDASNDQLLESDIQVKRFAVRNVIEDVIVRDGYVFEEDDEHYGILLIGSSDKMHAGKVKEVAEEVRACIFQFAKVSVTIGTGEIVSSSKDVERSYYYSRKMLDMRFLFGNIGILTERVSLSFQSTNDLDAQNNSDMMDAMKWGHMEDVKRLLHQKWDYLRNNPSEEVVKSVAMEIFVDLYRLVKERGTSTEHLFDSPMKDYVAIMEAKTMEALFQFVEKRCLQVAQYLHRSKPPQASQTIEAVKKLVKEQFSQNISLKDIAEQIYMNPAYLGRLFKSSEGVSFNEYLMTVRMEQAKAYLRDTDKKVYEIAQEVGYHDIDWFYKKFKQYAGVSTSEFRTYRKDG